MEGFELDMGVTVEWGAVTGRRERRKEGSTEGEREVRKTKAVTQFCL
jgi:hypothetical protein